jgi:hypothetical protein
VALEAAWTAILEGRATDVPREVWLAVIAVAAGLLGMLVLRPRRAEGRVPRPPRRASDLIDWSSFEGQADGSSDGHRREAA